jgi:hypothetical protein
MMARHCGRERIHRGFALYFKIWIASSRFASLAVLAMTRDESHSEVAAIRLWSGPPSARFRANLAARGQTAAMPDSEWRKKNSWNFPVS